MTALLAALLFLAAAAWWRERSNATDHTCTCTYCERSEQ